MADYLKNFETTAEYQTYINGNDVLKPNVSYIEDNNGVYYNPIVPPQPIAPAGKVQVFANPECTEYADGQSDTVYVRLNQAFGFNDTETWGNINNQNNHLQIGTSTTKYPNDGYSINLWVDWTDVDHEYTQPFTSGEIVKCYSYSFWPIDNPKVIFE